MVAKSEQGGPDYKVGYGRPPEASKFKPGQRANPKGRPPGSPNLKTIVERTLRKKIPVRRGEKTSKVTMLQAIAETHALKAAQGDRQAAGVVINLATRAGIFSGWNETAQSEVPMRAVQGATSARPSDTYVESVDPNLLSKDEQIDLSKIAQQIDVAGDVIDLSGADFARLKQIMNKGRGKNVVSNANDDLDQAA